MQEELKEALLILEHLRDNYLRDIEQEYCEETGWRGYSDKNMERASEEAFRVLTEDFEEFNDGWVDEDGDDYAGKKELFLINLYRKFIKQ